MASSNNKKSPLLAASLSGLFPGLGQLYVGERRKAALFFIAGLLTGFGPFNPLETDIPLDDIEGGLIRVLLASLPFLALAMWSVIDAYRRARQDP